MDRVLLEYAIKRKGCTILDFCNRVGISRSAYYRKVNGTSEFTQKEIQKAMDFLGLDSPVDIFFCTKSVLKETKR